MHLSNNDLEFLIRLENKLGEQEGWSDDVIQLWNMIEKLIDQRDVQRTKTRIAIANGRKIDKNYGRSKNK